MAQNQHQTTAVLAFWVLGEMFLETRMGWGLEFAIV
jgi:hypothetical protein